MLPSPHLHPCDCFWGEWNAGIDQLPHLSLLQTPWAFINRLSEPCVSGR